MNTSVFNGAEVGGAAAGVSAPTFVAGVFEPHVGDGLVRLPAVEVVARDSDALWVVVSDDELGDNQRLTVREDPDWAVRYKTLVTDDLRKWLSEDLADWPVVFSSTETTDPPAEYALALVVSRTSMALLSPGRYRYVAQVTDLDGYNPTVAPVWVSVHANADSGAS